eukprot:1749942-Prymnesium_polylepis.2
MRARTAPREAQLWSVVCARMKFARTSLSRSRDIASPKCNNARLRTADAWSVRAPVKEPSDAALSTRDVYVLRATPRPTTRPTCARIERLVGTCPAPPPLGHLS